MKRKISRLWNSFRGSTDTWKLLPRRPVIAYSGGVTKVIS